MADVGVLNLQIHDNSEQSAAGLDHLVDALERVRTAVGSGIKLSGINTQIRNIAKAVNDSLTDSTFARIEQLADSLSKLQGIGDIRIKIQNAGEIKGVRESIKETGESVTGIATGFEQVERRVGEMAETVKDTMPKLDFSKFDPALLPKGALGQTMEDLRNGAQEIYQFGAAVKDADRIVSQMRSNNGLDQFLKNEQNAATRATSATEDLKASVEEATAARDDNVSAMRTEEQAYEDHINQIIEETRELREAAEAKRAMQEQQFAAPMNVERTNGMAAQLTQLDLLKAQLRDAEVKYNDFVTTIGASATKTIKAGLELNRLRNKVEALEQAAERAGEATQSLSLGDLPAQMTDTVGSLQTNAVGNLPQQFEEARECANTLTTGLAEVDEELHQKRPDAEDAARGIGTFNGSLHDMRSALRSAFPHLTNLFARIKSIITRRAITAALRTVVSGFKEGVENVYRYSSAIHGSFAKSMDSAASSLSLFKNSIGAAVAPLIEMLIPYIQQAINWLVNLINTVNQFFALMNGQSTWTRAVPQTEKAFSKQTKAAKGTANAIKELLADWDELNIIQSETSGAGAGAGTGAAEDYLKMFEEVSVFDDKVKDAVSFVRDNFETIKNAALAIGAAILGWKLSSTLIQGLGTIGSLAAGVALTIVGIKWAYDSAFQGGLDGEFSDEDVLKMIGGICAAALGGTIVATTLFGSSAALIGFGIGLGVGILFSLIGYVEGSKERMDILKWGEGSMTPEQVKDYVENSFTFDIQGHIKSLELIIDQWDQTDTEMNKAKAQLNTTVQGLTTDAEDMTGQMNEAKESYDSFVAALSQKLGVSVSGLTELSKLIPFKDADGNDISGQLIEKLANANDIMQNYFTGVGQRIAGWIDSGISSQWTLNEGQMIIDLMNHVNSVVNSAEEHKMQNETEIGLQTSLARMSRENAADILDEQIDILNDYSLKLEEAVKKQIVDYEWYAELAEGFGLVDENGDPLSKVYMNMAQELRNKITNGEIYKDYIESVKKIKKEWIAKLREVYGEDENFDLGFNIHDPISDLLNMITGNDLEGYISRAKQNQQGVDEAAKYITGLVEAVLGPGVDTMKKFADKLGFSLFEVLDPANQKEIIRRIYQTSNNDADVTMAILKSMGLSTDSIAEMINTIFDEGASQSDVGGVVNNAITDALTQGNVLSLSFDEFKKEIQKMYEEFGKNEVIGTLLANYNLPEKYLDWLFGEFNGTNQMEVPAEIEVAAESAEGGLTLTFENGKIYAPDGSEWIIPAELDVRVNKTGDEDWNIWDGLEDLEGEIDVEVGVGGDESQELANDANDIIDIYKDIEKTILGAGLSNPWDALKQLNDLYISGNYEAIEDLKNLIAEQGIDIALDMLDNYLNGWDWSVGNRKTTFSSDQIIGSNAISDMPIGKRTSETNAENEAERDDALVRGVTAGVRTANADQNDYFRTMVNWLSTIARNTAAKNNQTPSSDDGRYTSQSVSLFSNISGNTVNG